ncbi:hypothetical protein CBER1_06497 [Cercospora berteroae]|uniref:Siderophore biosynthesis enzyme n=1 Tax=Cercospora berteroae TaxID=357750 RepID=A0A2S6BTK9_9PEZI|nr:hypothetical protein CBER1_06497 [Cercospora berteroae]
MYRSIFTAASLATLALAKTDIGGCTSSDVSSPAGASMIYYVPGTGEICEFLDCGGGRAPPKTTVPGCPQYSGTETYSPSFLPGYGAMETGSSASSAAAESTSTASEAEATTEETGSAYAQTTNVATSSLATDYTTASSSDETTLITSPAAYTSAVVGGGSASNGTTTVGGGRNNSTVTSGTPSLPESTGAAMEVARVWVGGVAMMGLGAVVAAL